MGISNTQHGYLIFEVLLNIDKLLKSKIYVPYWIFIVILFPVSSSLNTIDK
jgi:hypothetical protein